MAMRRGRIGRPYRDRAVADLLALPIEGVPTDDLTAVLRFADAHGLTIYDAAYLTLALERALPLATLDRALSEAAAATGVTSW